MSQTPYSEGMFFHTLECEFPSSEFGLIWSPGLRGLLDNAQMGEWGKAVFGAAVQRFLGILPRQVTGHTLENVCLSSVRLTIPELDYMGLSPAKQQ